MNKETPLILAFVGDLMTQSKIENVTRRLGYQTTWIENATFFGEVEKRDKPGEPLRGGQTTILTKYLSDNQPALMIFDITNPHIPWARWLAILKSSPATRRIPALVFGPHVEAEQLEKAHKVGADGVLTRGQFVTKLHDHINKYAKRVDYAAIDNACAEPLSDKAVEGIRLFNSGEFYEAHHGLEDAWNEDKGAARELYRGILQVAVAYLQIERGNYRGATKMFLRVRQWLDLMPDVCRGINIAQLRADADAAQAELAELGAENIENFDRSRFRPILFVD